MPNRTDLLNHLINRYGLKSYLEIGVQNPAQNFDKIDCKQKFGVDPNENSGATFIDTSDNFFEFIYPVMSPIDLVFIDGMHEAEQVKRDFLNALNGVNLSESHPLFIVLHDCNPAKEEHTTVPRPMPTGHWNGDVYKFALWLTYGITHDKHSVSMVEPEDIVPPVVVDIDNGCLVFDTHKNVCFNNAEPMDIPWSEFDSHRKEYLNLISWNEFIRL